MSWRKVLNGTWSIRQPLPFGIADAPAISYGDKILVFGGYGKSPSDVKSQVLEYNQAGDLWQLRSPMSKARWGAAATLCGDTVYVFGGTPTAKLVECYDIVKDIWKELNSLPSRLRSQGLMAVTVGSEIYLFNEHSTFAYDPVRDRYETRADAPLARRWATCACVSVSGEERIHIIGGWDLSLSDATDVNYYYLPTDDAWIGPCSPAPYRAYGATRDNPTWKNRILFGFGHRNPDLFFKDIYVYDPKGDSWDANAAKALFERDGVGCAITNDGLHVIGGRSEPNDATAFGLPYNERLQLSFS